jgi:hypothetical protein
MQKVQKFWFQKPYIKKMKALQQPPAVTTISRGCDDGHSLLPTFGVFLYSKIFVSAGRQSKNKDRLPSRPWKVKSIYLFFSIIM